MQEFIIPPELPASLHTLSNGLRVALRQGNGAVSYIGCLAGAGSRDDAPGLEGEAHFVEHTIFKGTAKRNSIQIANRLEEVGGSLNAYTTKEETMVYTQAPAGFEERAVDLLSDLVLHPTFPKDEIDKERAVILEEIHSCLDNPVEALFDSFDDIIYSGSGFGHNILGTPESIARIGSAEALDFLTKYYTPGNMVVYCQSPLPEDKALKLIEKYFGELHREDTEKSRPLPPVNPRFDLEEEHELTQANAILGCRVINRRDPRRYALYLLNNYLGGPGMNSRLNQELRDRRGLVYSVDCSTALMTNAGLELIYFGTTPSNVAKCRKVIAREFERLASSPLSPRTFDKIKRQFLGQIFCNSDSVRGKAMGMAKGVLNYGKIPRLKEQVEQIKMVSRDDFREMAELVASDGFSFLCYK